MIEGMKKFTIIGIVLYAMVVCVIFFPAFGAQGIISGGDIAKSHYFYMTYLRDSVFEGRLPLWNPYIFLGQPFLANPSIAFWYPATWLFIFLPIPTAFLVHMMFHVWWSMIGIYVLIVLITGKKYPAFIGGLVFGLCGYTMAHVYAGNYDVIAAGSWIGWVLFASLVVMHVPNRRNAAFLALCVGAQLLAGYASMSLYTLLIMGILSLFYWRRIGWIVVGGALGIAFGAIQLLPNIEFSQLTIRTITQWYPLGAFGSITPKYFLQLLFPFPFGGIATPYQSTEVMYWEHAMYVGIGVCVVAVYGICISLRHKKNIGFIVALIFAVWCAFGWTVRYDLYHFLWNIVAPFRYIRIPGRFVYIIDCMMAIFVGIGIAGMKKVMQYLVSIIIFVELIVYARHFIVVRPIPDQMVDQSVRNMISKALRPGERFSTTNPYQFGHDAPVSYRLPSTNGYDVTALRGQYEFITAVLGLPNYIFTDLANYEIPIGHPLHQHLSVRVSIDEKGMYQNERILPMFRVVPFHVTYNSRDMLYEAIKTKKIPVDTTVGFVRDTPKISGTPCTKLETDAVAITTFQPEIIHLSIRAPCSGYVTGSHVYFPGWNAYIDGKETKVYEGNLGFLTFPIERGVHKVVLKFHSTQLGLGAMLTFASFFVIILLYKYEHKKVDTK